MPENIQGQFEKRLYLNTRIKSGGTYTTEGPHGLAFVEELNNYVTENQNTSITLGSSDHKVSILFDGPSTFVRDGIGISSSVPDSPNNRLYNNNGDLYWNGSKISYKYVDESLPNRVSLGGGYYKPADIILSASDSIVFEGPRGIMSFIHDTEIFSYNDVFINADYIHLNDSTLVVGPSNDIIFNGAASFNALSSFSNQGLTITSNTTAPSVTTNKLYNYKGDLYWNGTKLNEESITFNYIREETDTLYLGSSAKDVTVSSTRSVLVKGPNESQIQLSNYGISIKTNQYDDEATIFIQGPGNYSNITLEFNKTLINNNFVQFGHQHLLPTSVVFNGPATFNAPVELSSLSSHPFDQNHKLYNKDGDLYWDGTVVVAGPSKISLNANEVSINTSAIVTGPNGLSLKANEVKINSSAIVTGPYGLSLNGNEVKINGTSIVSGPSETRFYYTSIVVGPEIIKSNANQIYFGQEGIQATSVIFSGPVTFNGNGVTLNGTVAINGPIRSGVHLDNNIPSDTSSRLYNNNGDLYWNGSKVGGSSYDHIVEHPGWLYLGWNGVTGTEINRIQTWGKKVDTYFNSLTYDGPSVSFENIQHFNINGYGHSNLVIGPKGIRIASNDSIIINGPINSQISLASNGIHLGDELNPCTTTVEGPSYFKNTLELSSLSSHPSYRDHKLYNKDGDLYWDGTVVVAGPSKISLNTNEVSINSSAIVAGPNEISLKANEVKINNSAIVTGPYGLSLNGAEVSINGTAFVAGPSEVKICDSIFVVGPNVIALRSNEIQIGSNSTATTMFIVGPVIMNHLLYLRDTSLVPIGPTDQDFLRNFKGDLYWNESKVSNSIIEVDYQDVDDAPYKRGLPLTLENNTIYNFDPDHDVDIREIHVKPWNTPQLHLYFNNTSSGKSKMTFQYPTEWKWINQSTPPSDNDFKEGYLYCIALRSVANPVYSQSSTTPPYNQQYIVIANIAYEVPVDV